MAKKALASGWLETVRQLGYERLRDTNRDLAPNEGIARQKLERAACGTKLHPGNNVPACSDPARFPDVSVAELIRANGCRERSSDIGCADSFTLAQTAASAGPCFMQSARISLQQQHFCIVVSP
jgi:hypothetical protein